VDNDNTARAGEVSFLIDLLCLPIKRTMHQAEAEALAKHGVERSRITSHARRKIK
jgi:hypothetical protein